MPARPVADLDRFLAHLVAARNRAPDARFRQLYTRRIDALLDERSAAHTRSGPPASTSTRPPVR